MNKKLIKASGILLVLVGAAQLVLTYFGFNAYQLLLEHNRAYFETNSIDPSTWNIIWLLHDTWILGLAALLAGILIFWHSIYTWSFFLATCITLLIDSGISLYQYQFRKIEVAELGIAQYENLILMVWIIPLVVSILGLAIALNKVELKSLPTAPKKWYYSLAMTIILITLVFIV
ncbi:hypothetical protein K6119_10730 [Paracrocinitomix mangrovi]|uniref:hypothetical protein n=1 Tax=Paracrocinitomix mangrovi TaxID=2862509 RepID=UPI001C8DF65D|nr:hypothetical protein [Paracrocinitomix mangrovi]UKN00207.1 hypothetical protein K6119_10730 [Paracrocinitomix mangrovi]